MTTTAGARARLLWWWTRTKQFCCKHHAIKRDYAFECRIWADICKACGKAVAKGWNNAGSPAGEGRPSGGNGRPAPTVFRYRNTDVGTEAAPQLETFRDALTARQVATGHFRKDRRVVAVLGPSPLRVGRWPCDTGEDSK